MKFNTKLKILFTILVMVPLITSCGPFKYKPVDAREVSLILEKELRRILEEGRGMRIMGGLKKEVNLTLQVPILSLEGYIRYN